MSTSHAAPVHMESPARKSRAPAKKPAAGPKARRTAADDYKVIDQKLSEIRVRDEALRLRIGAILERLG